MKKTKGSEKEDDDSHDDQEKENKRVENEDMKRNKTVTRRSSMVEHVKRNKRKLLQDSSYTYAHRKV